MRFNSDVGRRLRVAVALVNGQLDAPLGERSPADRPHAVFTENGFQSTRVPEEWAALATFAQALLRVVELLTTERQRGLQALDGLLATTPTQVHLEEVDGRVVTHLHGPATTFAQGWTAAITLALAMSLDGHPRPAMRGCGALGCRRLFLDLGRNQQRKFCSLQCQNPSKAATYRARRSASTGATSVGHVGGDRGAELPSPGVGV